MWPRIGWFLAAALVMLLSGAAAEPSGEAAGAGRVVLVPLNVAVRAAPELEAGIDPVWQELVRYFEARQPRVASLAREGADLLWKAAAAEPEARDAAGERDVYAAYAHFARRVAEQVEYESLVIPSLVTRTVKVHGRQAVWDGVERIVDLPQASIAAFEASLAVNGMQGALSAASLHVAVLTPEGELRYEGAGGLTLLQRPELRPEEGGSAVQLADRSAAFEDREALREGIAIAFEKPLPASRTR